MWSYYETRTIASAAASNESNAEYYKNLTSFLQTLRYTIVVGERSSNHSPATWTGAVSGGLCPAWMAASPATPYLPPPSPAYDNADFGEALIFAHCNATHLPNADFPIYDPDVFYSLHTGGAQFLLGDGSVRFISSFVDGRTYQALATIAGSETIGEF